MEVGVVAPKRYTTLLHFTYRKGVFQTGTKTTPFHPLSTGMGLEGNLILFCCYPQLEVHRRGHFIKFLCFIHWKAVLQGISSFLYRKWKLGLTDCRMKTVSSELGDPVMAEPCANQPIWQRMHSLIPEGFSVTCQRTILGSPQWERQEVDSNPQLKWLEQNNSAGITEHGLVSSLWVYVLGFLKVIECKGGSGGVGWTRSFFYGVLTPACCSVTAPEAFGIASSKYLKSFAGRTAVGCRDGKQKSPSLSLWVCLQKDL